jgi:AcrR family transcriptional regulator
MPLSAAAQLADPASDMPDAIEDGRHKRSAESRRRIIDAMLALVQEGHPEPGAEAVALRAGVGLRTVFRLFRDMESLCAEMLVPQRLEFVECFTARFEARRGAARVEELFERLATLYEKRMPLRRAGAIRRYSSPSLAGAMHELDDTIAAFLADQFAADSDAGKIRLNMLNLLVSYETWMRLRDSQGLSFVDATVTLRAALRAFTQGE